jgi:hypothetical protein
VPQLAQCWMRSSPAAVPAQKNAVSGVTCGRMGLTGFSVLVGPDGAGLNLRMRKSMVATGSPAENQVLRVVTNQPSPSTVRLGPVTSRSLARTVSCSPSLRYRW